MTQIFKITHADVAHVDQVVRPFLSGRGANSLVVADQGLLIVTDYADNMQRIASTYDKMDAKQASKIIINMASNKQLDDAVKIIYLMSERTSADLLGEIAATKPDLASLLSAELKRDPSVSEIADEIDTAEYEVLEAIEAKQCRYPVSMETPARPESDETAPAERIGAEDGTFEEVEDNLTLRAAADDLSETDRQVLRLRFREDMTQSEIADRIGYSQMHVSRILRRSIDTMREALMREAA